MFIPLKMVLIGIDPYTHWERMFVYPLAIVPSDRQGQSCWSSPAFVVFFVGNMSEPNSLVWRCGEKCLVGALKKIVHLAQAMFWTDKSSSLMFGMLRWWQLMRIFSLGPLENRGGSPQQVTGADHWSVQDAIHGFAGWAPDHWTYILYVCDDIIYFFYLYTHLFMKVILSIYLLICLSIYSSMRSFIHSFMHACMHACMHSFIHSFIYLFIIIYIFIELSMYFYFYLFIFFFIYLCTHNRHAHRCQPTNVLVWEGEVGLLACTANVFTALETPSFCLMRSTGWPLARPLNA